MKVPDPPQRDLPQADFTHDGDPLAARLRAAAAELRRSPAPDFTARVREAVVSAQQVSAHLVSSQRGMRGLRPRALLLASAAAALLLTLGFATWSSSSAQAVTTGARKSAGPRVVQIAHPRGWGALLCDSYSTGVEGRLESELDGVLGDVGQLARALLARVPSGLLGRLR